MHSACQHLYFGRLLTVGAGFDLEGDPLAFPEGLVAIALDGLHVHEDIQAAILLDEAVACLGAKPFDGARGFPPVAPRNALARGS